MLTRLCGVVPNNLKWIGNLSHTLLLNNNLLIRRDKSQVLNNCTCSFIIGLETLQNQLMYPLPTPPLIHCLPTPISLWKDMERKIFKGQNYLIWLKSHKHSMSSGNALRIAVVPENPLRKVKAHRCTAGHDPTRVRTNIVKRNNVQVILVRPPYNINIHHYINEASTV